MNRTLLFVSLISILATAGCNKTSEGAEGIVDYTPDMCDLRGRGCSFDDSIAVGGDLIVHIEGATQDVSTVGFDLESDDLSVLSVAAIPDVGGRPTWEIVGEGAGVARLYAVDADGNDVDFLEVSVQEIDNLFMYNTVGEAVGGPVDGDPDYHEVWAINANLATWFYVTPAAGTAELMGVMQYGVVIDGTLEAQLGNGSDVSGGFYQIDATAGDYTLEITADNGTPLDVLFQVQ